MHLTLNLAVAFETANAPSISGPPIHVGWAIVTLALGFPAFMAWARAVACFRAALRSVYVEHQPGKTGAKLLSDALGFFLLGAVLMIGWDLIWRYCFDRF